MRTTNSAAAITALCVGMSAAVAGAQDLPLLQRDVSGAAGSTVSGCVARGAGPGTYALADAARQDGRPPLTGDQLFTTVLTGKDVDLAAHVGHLVSMTGSYAPVIGPVGTSGTIKPVPAATAGSAAKAVRTFMVKSLKMVSASCSEAAE